MSDDEEPLFTDPDDLPVTPYAGTSGWSGSATSQERALRDDEDGTTTVRQRAALSTLAHWASTGRTWKELADSMGWHHGQASGVLSVLHKDGRVARLTERRQRCQVYVLPEHVGDRDTVPHGRNRRTAPTPAATADQAAAARRLVKAADTARLTGGYRATVDRSDLDTILDALNAVYGPLP